MSVRALFHVAAFLFGSAAWVLVLGLVVVFGLGVEDPAELGPRAIAAFAVAQAVGMGGLAVGLSRALPPGVTFPVGGGMGWSAAGVAAGLVGWVAPSWLADQLRAFTGEGTLDAITAALTSPDPLGRAAMAVAIAVSAPLFEEVVFRGYLWRALEVYGSPRAAYLGTTLLFCAYHLDPVQSTALLPTAALLGWLRLRSGSLLPPIAMHFVNNALGVALAGVELPMPAWGAAAGAWATVLLVMAGEGRADRSR